MIVSTSLVEDGCFTGEVEYYPYGPVKAEVIKVFGHVRELLHARGTLTSVCRGLTSIYQLFGSGAALQKIQRPARPCTPARITARAPVLSRFL